MKTWRSTNCSCLVEELYDGKSIIGIGQILEKCDAHKDLGGDILYSAMNGECKKVGDFLREMLKDDELSGEVLEDGKFIRKLKVEPKYIFEGEGENRTLKVEGLPEGKEDIIKNKLKNV